MKLFNGKVLRAWKDVPNYEGLYQVSTDGQIRSLDRYVTYKKGKVVFYKGKKMKLHNDKDGYLTVGLSKDNKTKQCKVHRLVALCFIPNVNNLQEVDHIDTNRENNSVSNLRWVSREENNNNPLTRKHYSKRSSGANNPKAKAVYCYELDEIRLCGKDWDKELNLPNQGATSCCNGERRSSRGYHFRWATQEEIEKLYE